MILIRKAKEIVPSPILPSLFCSKGFRIGVRTYAPLPDQCFTSLVVLSMKMLSECKMSQRREREGVSHSTPL